jgi:UDP-glucose 4-epimerase
LRLKKNTILMKILVTGGAGFIGSHTVVELYESGYEPIILDNFKNSEKSALIGIEKIIGKKVKFYEGDCNDSALLVQILTEERITGVIHFAAWKAVGESVENPLKYYKNNINSTLVLLEAMQETSVKNLVFSSSCTVYGQPDTLPVTEKSPRKDATSPYGNTKRICEDMIRDAVMAKAPMRAISLRYFNPVGAHPSAYIGELPSGIPSNLVPFITQAAAGIRQKLMIWGNDYNTPDGTCIRDYIHVVDLAQAHVKALDLLQKNQQVSYYDVFNLGTGEGVSVQQLIDTFEEVNQIKVNYQYAPRREGDIEQIYAQVDKSTQILGWVTKKTLADSLRDAWRWQQKIGNSL